MHCPRELFLGLLGLMVLATAAHAERYAVLIGIDYQDCRPDPGSQDRCPEPLRGPRHDVQALKTLLSERYGFAPERITTLLNRDASRSRILTTLEALQRTTKPRDFLFVYFSGHGTSGADPDLRLDLASATGALVPHDFRGSDRDPQRMLAGLLVGKRDLRPIFAALDRERPMLVVFDTCFSGNTVRSQRPAPGMAKYMALPLGGRTRNVNAPGDLPAYTPTFTARPKEPYPYTNLIYISASDETEIARDISGDTVDGQPHGALTNALLIGLNGKADTNNNRTITYQELYQFVRQAVQPRGHTPQLLAQTNLERPVFEHAQPVRNDAPDASTLTTPASALRVKLEGNAQQSLQRQLSALNGVKLTDAQYEILVAPEGSGYALYVANGDMLCQVKSGVEVVERLQRYARVRELVHLRNPQQHFNVWLQAGDKAGQTVFFEGDKMDLRITSEQAASVLLMNIDPHGYVNAILSRVTPAKPLLIPGGKVEPPLGTEYMKLFAFRRAVPGLEQFGGGKLLDPTGPEVPAILALIKGENEWAETIQEIVTVKRP